MHDELLSLLAVFVLAPAIGIWPVGFLFAVCSDCCRPQAASNCPWFFADMCAQTRLLEVGACSELFLSNTPGLRQRTPSIANAGVRFTPVDVLADGTYRVLKGRYVGARLVDGGFLTGYFGHLVEFHPACTEAEYQVSVGLGNLTPLAAGVSESYIFRFLLSCPAGNAVFDAEAPPWHLQVDCLVTGVASAAESGIEYEYGTDDYGQPKLIVSISQGPGFVNQSITVPVTLFPSGKQRWVAPLNYNPLIPAYPPSGGASGPAPTFSGCQPLGAAIATMVAKVPQGAQNRVSVNGGTYKCNKTSLALLVTGPGYPNNDPFFLSQNPNPGLRFGYNSGQGRIFVESENVLSVIDGQTELEFTGQLWSGQTPNCSTHPQSSEFIRVGMRFGPHSSECFKHDNSDPSNLYGVVGLGELLGCELLSATLNTGRRNTTFTADSGFVREVSFTPTAQPRCWVLYPTYERTYQLLDLDGGQPPPTTTTTIQSGIPCDGCEFLPTVVNEVVHGDLPLVEVAKDGYSAVVTPARTWLEGESLRLSVACGGQTREFRILVPQARPRAVQGLAVTRDVCSEAVLTWLPPAHNGGSAITSYVIRMRRLGGSFQVYSVVGSNNLSTSVVGLLRLGYEFTVAAVNALGEGPSSSVSTGFVLGAPTNLTSSRTPPNCGSAQLSWTAPTQSDCVVVASYRIEFRVVGASSWTVFSSVPGAQTTGEITGLPFNVRHEFRVARVDDAGSDVFSNTITSGNLPFIPFGVTATLGEDAGSVNLAWSASETPCFENTDYNVQFRPSTTTIFADLARATSANKFATVTGLMPGVQYFFRVRAVNLIGTSSFSFSATITLPAP